MPEFTVRAVIVGTLLGVMFGASSLYLVLKVGLTVSASIPVAVISLALFRILSKFGFRDATILENNITQTAGSAGESIAFGVGVTMPAIMILGFDLDLTRVLLVAVLGRPSRHPDDDPAAPRPDREGARDPQVSRGDGLRGRPDGGSLGGGPRAGLARRRGRDAGGRGRRPRKGARGQVHLHRAWHRDRLQRPQPRVPPLEGHAREGVRGPVQRGLGERGDLAGAPRHRLHHRAEDRGPHVRRVACSPTWS